MVDTLGLIDLGAVSGQGIAFQIDFADVPFAEDVFNQFAHVDSFVIQIDVLGTKYQMHIVIGRDSSKQLTALGE